jgi:hypothetical protein
MYNVEDVDMFVDPFAWGYSPITAQARRVLRRRRW